MTVPTIAVPSPPVPAGGTASPAVAGDGSGGGDGDVFAALVAAADPAGAGALTGIGRAVAALLGAAGPELGPAVAQDAAGRGAVGHRALGDARKDGDATATTPLADALVAALAGVAPGAASVTGTAPTSTDAMTNAHPAQPPAPATAPGATTALVGLSPVLGPASTEATTTGTPDVPAATTPSPGPSPTAPHPAAPDAGHPSGAPAATVPAPATVAPLSTAPATAVHEVIHRIAAASTATDAGDTSEPTVAGAPTGAGTATGVRSADPPSPVEAAPDRPALPLPPHGQVARAIGSLRHAPDGTYAVRVDLHPADLGSVSVDITVRDGTVSLLLHADDAGTRDLLRDTLADLRHSLEDAGLQTTGLGVGSDGASGSRPHPHADRAADAPGTSPPPADAEVATEQPRDVRRGVRRTTTGLDLHL